MAIETDLLIIGGGMASARLLQALNNRQYKRRIVVACAEAEIGYNRVQLPRFLAGHITRQDLLITDPSWRQLPGLSLLPNCPIEALDLQRRCARTGDGREIIFDELALATGSNVIDPCIPGLQYPLLQPLRSFGDAQTIITKLSDRAKVTVLGGGLLGLESADALAARGHQVQVVHRADRLMNRQLDARAGNHLADKLRRQGISISLATQIEKVESTNGRHLVHLTNSSRHLTDLVLLATGVQPNVKLAQAARIPCGRGITVDEQLATAIPGVYALGESAEPPGNVPALVEVVHRQADALAARLCGSPTALASSACGTQLKVQHTNVYAVGATATPRPTDAWVDDPSGGVYRRLFLQEKTLVGAVLYGDTRASRNIAALIGHHLQPGKQEQLLFGTG